MDDALTFSLSLSVSKTFTVWDAAMEAPLAPPTPLFNGEDGDGDAMTLCVSLNPHTETDSYFFMV